MRWCAHWLASPTPVRRRSTHYRYSLAPLRERHGDLPAQKLTRPDLDKLLIALREGGTTTAKGKPRRAWSARSLNKAVDAWRRFSLGVERREVSRNVAASMKKVPRCAGRWRLIRPTRYGGSSRRRQGP